MTNRFSCNAKRERRLMCVLIYDTWKGVSWCKMKLYQLQTFVSALKLIIRMLKVSMRFAAFHLSENGKSRKLLTTYLMGIICGWP